MAQKADALNHSQPPPDLVEDEQQRGGSSGGASETTKKRFCLRDELAEVRSLMEGGGGVEEQCASLHKHYQHVAREYKKLERRLVECQKKQLEVAQHRDIIQNEYARVNLAKSKLENLCRELQRHSKAVAEESKLRQQEEEERRREVSSKFSPTINEITVKMQEHHQRNQALRQENLELATKLKQLAEQYDAREEQFEKIMKHKHLELQLSEAKLAQQEVAAAEDKENSLAERQYLLAETLEQQKRCEQLTMHEADLRGQLSLYSEKFEEFQQTLTKSNEVFSTFKKEMDKMSKTIGKLEKEMLMWKSRYEKCNRSLLEMAEERIAKEKTMQTLKMKNEKLEKLCRALQSERNQLGKELKKKGPAQDTVSDKDDDAADESAVEDTTVGTITEESGGAEGTVSETQPIVSKLKEAQQEEGEVSNGALTEIDTDDSVLQRREPDSVAHNESCDGDEGTPPCAEPA